MAKTEIDSKAAEAANEEQVKETETQAEAEVVKEKEASSEDAQAPEGEKEKKGFFSKKKDKKDEQIGADGSPGSARWLNLTISGKRTEKEKSVRCMDWRKDIIEKILPVVDNVERGLATIPEGEEKSAFAEGMDKVYKQLVKTLGDAGVKPIEAVGQPFDPNFHNAVMHIEDENLAEKCGSRGVPERLCIPRQRGSPQHGKSGKLK